jgi:hypothetical protein
MKRIPFDAIASRTCFGVLLLGTGPFGVLSKGIEPCQEISVISVAAAFYICIAK